MSCTGVVEEYKNEVNACLQELLCSREQTSPENSCGLRSILGRLVERALIGPPALKKVLLTCQGAAASAITHALQEVRLCFLSLLYKLNRFLTDRVA
jgi:hypothetical protein